MGADDDLELIAREKAFSLVATIVVRTSSHLVLLPSVLVITTGIAPHQITKRTLLGYFYKTVELADIVYIIIKVLKRAALGEIPACTAKYLLSITAASGILVKRSRKRS